MKALFLALLLANLALFAATQGYLGRILPDGREPERMDNQIKPEKIVLISPEQAAKIESQFPGKPAQAERTACVELGAVTGEDIKRAQALLASMDLGTRLSTRKASEAMTFMVYMPSQGNLAAANSKSAELKKLGVTDFFVMQEEGQFKFAISLGVFKSEEGAKNHLATLNTKGVKTARIVTRGATVDKAWFQVRDVEAALYGRLDELRRELPGADLKECAR